MILRSRRGVMPLDAIYAAAAQLERWPETLTRVAALIAGGLSGRQAAAVLGISPTTLKSPLLRCFEKTGVRSRRGRCGCSARL